MRNVRNIFILVLVSICLFISCAKEKPVRPTPPEIPDNVKPQDIPPEMKYPGCTPFENAVYEFLASDPPELVVQWFETNVKDITIEQRTAKNPRNTEWTIDAKDFEIVIAYGPSDTDTLIRYKPKKGLPDKKEASGN